ncbi:hypothetical protein H7J06_01995 [Mycobacterium hodleri]|nr:hypothetical protein [Mycolicibacterium hodleri]
MTVRQRLHGLALHGVVRSAAAFGERRGDPQARLIADPAVRADPGAFADELREAGRLVRGRAGRRRDTRVLRGWATLPVRLSPVVKSV